MKTYEDDFIYNDALKIASLIRNKSVSCREVMEAFLKRIKDVNPKVNAIVHLLDEEMIMERALKADEAIAKKSDIGILHGLPIAAKEMLDVQGWPTTYCWKAGFREEKLKYLDYQNAAENDSILASRMRKSGLIFIGKTNMPEFAFGSHTRNNLFGTTCNPYDLSKTVGGSSGGAASALASGMLPIADGNDLGGSLRNPAAFCNVVGFRPSIGRIPMLDAVNRARVVTEGSMGRSVRDVGMLLSVMAGPHKDDPLSIQEAVSQFQDSLKSDVKGIKIGWTSDFGSLPVEKEVIDVCSSCLKVFNDLGVEVNQDINAYPDLMGVDPNKGEMDAMDVFRILRVANLASVIMDFRNTIGIDGIRTHMNEISQFQMIDAFDKVDGKAVLKAHKNRERILGLFESFFKDHDFLVCPTVQVVPFDKNSDYVHQINDQPMSDYLEWMSICCILSITGFPIISLPCGFTSDGLPLGIQIVGKPKADLDVLRFAYSYEQATQFSPKNRVYRPDI